MKKTLAILSLGAMMLSAQAMTVEGTMTTANATGTSGSTQKTVCASNAVAKRDDAIISAQDANSQAIKAALTTRRDALKALYLAGKTEGKKDERKAVWSSFSTSVKSAMTDMRTARKSAWDTFQKDMASCGIKSNTEKMETVVTPIAY